jgi:membrane-associated phospholipid phosphatase
MKIDIIQQIHQKENVIIQELIEYIQTPLVDLFFWLWSFIDTFGFIAAMITIVWHLLGKSVGKRLFLMLTLSVAINIFLKELFALPRPCHSGEMGLVPCLASGGFPSGAAQTAALLACIVFKETKKASWRIAVIFYAIFLCFSRIYLQLHYISDIIGGLIVGVLLFLLYPLAKKMAAKRSSLYTLFFPGLLFILTGFHGLIFVSFTAGIELGLLAPQQTKKTKLKDKLAITILTLAGIFFLAYLSARTPALSLIYGLVMGAWLSALGEKGYELIKDFFKGSFVDKKG